MKDTTVCRGSELYTDQFFVISGINIMAKWKSIKMKTNQETISFNLDTQTQVNYIVHAIKQNSSMYVCVYNNSNQYSICILFIILSQLPSGEVQVHHDDGSIITFNSASGAVRFEKPDGQIKQYSEKDVLPDDLKIKLIQMPKIVQYLMKTETKIRSPVMIPRTNVIR